MKNQKTKFLIFGSVIALALILGILIININKNSKFRQQLQLGNEALLNLDYEGAITAFANAIGINPKDVNAFLGISKAYIALDDYSNASEYLIVGYYSIPAPTILGMLEPIEAKDLILLGNEFLSKREPTLAENAFVEALKKEPTNEEAHKGFENSKNQLISNSNNEFSAENETASQITNNNSNNIVPPSNASSTSKFNPYGFTFMGYPIHEDHYEEWKNAVGYIENPDPFDYTYIAPGNGFGETLQCCAYDKEKTISLVGNLYPFGEGFSTEDHTCWQMNSPAIQYYKYCFSLYPTVGNYSHIAKEHFSGPIQPGDSLTDILSLCGYTNGIPNYSEPVSLANGLQLFLSETSSPYGDKTLSIMGSTYNFIIYFTADQVTGLMLLYT